MRTILKTLKRWLGLEKDLFVVFHQDSPGVVLLVARNMWQQLTRPSRWSSIGERSLSIQQAVEQYPRYTRGRIEALYQEFRDGYSGLLALETHSTIPEYLGEFMGEVADLPPDTLPLIPLEGIDPAVTEAYAKFRQDNPLPVETEVSRAVGILTKALREDPGFAIAYHANIAMAMVDEGLDHAAANRGAGRFMFQWAGIDTSSPEFEAKLRGAAPASEDTPA